MLRSKGEKESNSNDRSIANRTVSGGERKKREGKYTSAEYFHRKQFCIQVGDIEWGKACMEKYYIGYNVGIFK